MDLRTIMNSDAGGASNRPPPSQSSSSPPDHSHQQRAQQSYPEHPARPPQPPLQHPQHATPDRSSSYGPAQSPYQQFNAPPPPLNTAVQSQRSQSPTHVSTPYGPGARDPYGASAYNSHVPPNPAGPLASPYTPQQPMSAGPQQPEQQSYFAQQRSHSLQSLMTNPRAPSETYRSRESPTSASQPLPHHQFSPTAHRSIPGTPLGPPAAFPARQSPSARPSSSGHDSSHNPLSSPRLAQDAHMRDSSHTQSPSLQRQISPGPRPSEQMPHLRSNSLQHDPSETASPKAGSRQNSAAATSDITGRAQMRSSEDMKANESPTTAFPSGPGSDSRASPVATGHAHMNSSPPGPRSGSHPLKMEVDQPSMPRTEDCPPKPKRRRYNEPPIYAQRSARRSGKCPAIPNPQPPIPKHARRSDQDPWALRRRSSTAAPGSVTSSRAPRTPGAAPAGTNGPLAQSTAPSTPPVGSLGPWEPSITGFIPHEEITKILCDFLFQHVVMRNDVAAGPAGSAAAGHGAIIEVEAKLGHIIDQDRGDRLQLPVLTESIVNRDNHRFRTNFESSMSIVRPVFALYPSIDSGPY